MQLPKKLKGFWVLLSLMIFMGCHKPVHKSEQSKVAIEKVELEEWITGANGFRKLTMVFYMNIEPEVELIPELMVFQHNELYYKGKPNLKLGPESLTRLLLTVDVEDGLGSMKGCEAKACLQVKVDGKVVSWEIERFIIRNADEDNLPE